MATKDFENKLCEIVENATSERAKFLTKWAHCYYILILRNDEPLGVAQFTNHGKYYFHTFNSIEGIVSSYFIERLERAAETMNERLNDLENQKKEFTNQELLDLIDNGYWVIVHEITGDELWHATKQNGTIEINITSNNGSTISFQTMNCMCIRKFTTRLDEYGKKWFLTKEDALNARPDIMC